MTLEKAKELPELIARANNFNQSGSTNFRSNGFARFGNNGPHRFGSDRTGERFRNDFSNGARTGWRSGNDKSLRNGRK